MLNLYNYHKKILDSSNSMEKEDKRKKITKKLSSWLILMVQHKCQKRENALINLTWRAILSYDSCTISNIEYEARDLWSSILILCPYNFHIHIQAVLFLHGSDGFLNSTVYFGTLICPFSTKSLLRLHGFLLTRLLFKSLKKQRKQRTPCTIKLVF